MDKEILYYLAGKSMIKFVDDATLYSVSEKIEQPLSLKKGDVVSVKLEEDKVIEISKVEKIYEEINPPVKEEAVKETKEEKAEEKKAEPVEEKEEVVVTKTITIVAVRHDKTACKLDDNTWPKISDELVKKDPFKLGIVAKAVIDVKMKDGIIVDVVAVKEEPKKKEEKEPTKSTYKGNSSVNSSIEKQCALKASATIVNELINKGLVSGKEIAKSYIKELTKTCYEAIQEL